MPARRTSVLYLGAILFLLRCTFATVHALERWSAKVDGKVRFYQSTELGVLIVGTEKSLYALDGMSGDVLWRRKNVKLDETDVAPVPGTDIVLLTLESGSKTRVEALDVMTGSANGLAGVNINSGSTERSIRMSAPDDRFLSDEEANLLYVSQDNRLLAYSLNNND